MPISQTDKIKLSIFEIAVIYFLSCGIPILVQSEDVLKKVQDIAHKGHISNAFVTKIGINYDMVHEYFRLGDSDRPSFDFVTF